MASYENITNTLNFAVAFKPTTAFPLDARSMFGSYSAAEAAAASAKNAGSSESIYYFGQILTVFENDVATHYSIQGDNTLKEVGTSVLGDNKTIVMNNSVLSLKDFGVKYYAYKPADTIIDNSESSYTYPDTMPEDPTEGSYVQIDGTWYKYSSGSWAVDSQHTPSSTSYYELVEGWKAGLEPKVVSDGSDYAIAWYEPSSTTVEGLQSIVSNLQTETDSLKSRVDTMEPTVQDTADGLEAEIARATAAEQALNNRVTAVEGITNGLGTAATKNVEEFATAAQGAKADSAVQSVTSGDTNGYANVDGSQVKIYEAPIASTSTVGDVKVDGASITASGDGTISVVAVDKSKVTGLDTALTETKNLATEDANTYTDENAVAKTDVVASGSQATDSESASDTKVVSEKLLIDSLNWKTTM